MKKTIKDIDVSEKRILVRADFNVPLKEGKVADDTRIRAALPTIKYLLEQNSKIILCSHLGRPGGEVVEELSLEPVAKCLSEILEIEVKKVDDCIGSEVEDAVDSMEPGDVLLLENTRFHPGEKENDSDFSAKLAKLADIYVNDAFGAAHRAHASTNGVASHLPAVAGLLMKQEIEALNEVVENPKQPLIMIIGGTKIPDKIDVIEKFLKKADGFLIGGVMANTFLQAEGLKTGSSVIEEEELDTAKNILGKAVDKLVLPIDVVITKESTSEHKTVPVERIPDGWKIVDIGWKTVDLFIERIEQANMVVWNGPMGLFEESPFDEGTSAIARKLAEVDAETIIGGGDTASALNQAEVDVDKITHVSTGGGAFLALIAEKELPGIAVLEDK